MDSEQIKFGFQNFAYILIIPPILYTITMACYVGFITGSSFTIARVSSIIIVIMNIIRFMNGISSFLFSSLIRDTRFVDYNVGSWHFL